MTATSTSTHENARPDWHVGGGRYRFPNVDGSIVDGPIVLLLAVFSKVCRRFPHKERHHGTHKVA